MVAQVLTSFSSCLRTVRVLFGPSHRHLGDVLTHGTSSGRRFVTKFLVSVNGVRAVYRTTTSLNMATPEHQPVDEIKTYAFSVGWNMGTTQQFVMWATAFLLVWTNPVSDYVGLFTAWVRSDRQIALYANICLSPP